MSDLPQDLIKDMKLFEQSSDRFAFLKWWLARCGVEGKKIEIKGKRHLLVRFNQPYDLTKKIKTFVAHYDKVEGSPGANDNAAAVFQLLSHAGRLAMLGNHGNSQILFTDGEEITEGPLSSQGSYQLAILFRQWGINRCQFYIFDMCGIGNSLAIGGAGSIMLEQALKELRITKAFYNEAILAMTEAAGQLKAFQGYPANWVYALFSDDLGFLLNGYPAVFFSTLHLEEAQLAHSQWRTLQENQEAMKQFRQGYFTPHFQNFVKEILPKSWHTMHSPFDKIENLERQAFVLIEDFLNFLTFSD